MRWSVYDYDRRTYDYYEAPGPGGTHAGAPPRPLLHAGGAVSPEAATWRLPIGAKKVGSGELPQGRIASTGASSSLGDLPPAASLPLVIGAAYLVWRIFR